MWDKDTEDLVMDLFNRDNDDLYMVDLDLIDELNKVDWKYLQTDLEYNIIILCKYLFQDQIKQ